MFTKAFWMATFERAIRTFAQGLVALLSANGLGVLDADWGQAASVAGMGTILSVLMSIAASGVGGDGPAFGTEELPDGRHEA